MLTFLRMIGWRNLLIVVLALALFLLLRRTFFGQSDQEIRVHALFDQVDFVQELKLVTYYSEELLQIGGEDDLKQEIQALETQLQDLKEEEVRLAAQDRLAQRRDSAGSQRLLRLQEDQQNLGGRLERVRVLRNNYPRLWGGIRNRLRSDPNAFGPQVADWYQHLDNLGRNSDEAEMFEGKIRREIASQVLQLEEEKGRIEGNLDRYREQIRIEERSLRSIRRDRDQQYTALVQMRLEIEHVALTLASKREELADREALTDEQPIRQKTPKLLAVVATGVSATTDLSRVSYEVVDDTILHFSCLPQAEIDQRVDMELAAEDGRFSLLSGKLRGMLDQNRGVAGERESVYVQVYREMKAALESMRQEVILNALQRGILQEADDLTRSYLVETGHALGFMRVTFGEPCEVPSVESEVNPQRIQTQQTVDSLLQRLDSAAQQ